VHRFSILMLHASQAFGAPAHLARVLGCTPQDVFQWISGTGCPGPEEQQHFERLLDGALEKMAARRSGSRRWVDRQPVAA